MKLIDEGNQNWGRHNEQQQVTQDEVRTPEGHFHDLHDELSGRLGDGIVSKATAVPFTSPPSSVCFIVFEFTRQEDRNEDLRQGTLNSNNGNNSQDGV